MGINFICICGQDNKLIIWSKKTPSRRALQIQRINRKTRWARKEMKKAAITNAEV
jgi:hypothetical protein